VLPIDVLMSTVVAHRQAIVDAGMFDESLRRGQDFDLWLRLAIGAHTIGYQRMVLAERRVRASGLSGDTISKLERAINVLDGLDDAFSYPLRRAPPCASAS
jgi:hypothetical protein